MSGQGGLPPPPAERRVLLRIAAYLLVSGLIFLAALARATAAAELLMVEQQGCVYCEQWNEEVAPEYPKTEEGRAAPLRRIDITELPPPDVELERMVNFTPTFILVEDGREIGRIEGYPGEDFFWGLLDRLLQENNLLESGT